MPDYEPNADGIPNTFRTGTPAHSLSDAGGDLRIGSESPAVITGVCETDFFRLSDCRDEFVESAESAVYGRWRVSFPKRPLNVD